MGKFSKVLTIHIICIVLFLPVLLPLIHPGFFVSDDGNWMVVRFSAFYEALRHGQFPVRFLPRLNYLYGYPVANFLYPLFMYIGVPIKVAGFSFVTTIKILFGLSFLSSGFFAFFWLKKLFDRKAAFIGSLVYLYFPYHVWDAYTRGSIGEILALSLVPFILWQSERNSLILTGVGIALLILAHNTLALLFLPLLLGYFMVRKLFSFQELVFIILMSLGMSAFFWMPALYEKQFTLFDTISVSDFSQYFITGSLYSLFGLITLIAIFAGIWQGFVKRSYLESLSLVALCLIIVFSLPISQPIWNIIPGRSLIQFPFRLLSLAILSTSFLIASFVNSLKKHMVYILGIMILVIGLSVWPFLTHVSFQSYPDSYYSTNVDTTTVKGEYMPIWVTQIPKQISVEKVTRIKGNGTVNLIKNVGNSIVVQTTFLTEGILQVNTIFYPGWQAFIDNHVTHIQYQNPQGVMQISIPKGTHIVTIQFNETPFRLLADSISLLTIIIIFFFLLRRGIYKRK